MKYIEKQPTPSFFIEDTRGLIRWNDYRAEKKRALKRFILANEQFQLCCYCEKIVTIEESHIEHFKPKSLDSLDSELLFGYANLLVSCEGTHFNEEGDFTKNTCGKKKDNAYNEDKLLNPTLILDISSYFIFNPDTGAIQASEKDPEKSEYTYKLLNLNGKNDRLAEARKKAKSAFINIMKGFSFEEQKQHLNTLLRNEGTEFITFFRYIFRDHYKSL